MFRIAELGADYFSTMHTADVVPLIHALGRAATRNWPKNGAQELALISEGYGNKLTQFLGFHPSIQRRLSIIQNSNNLIDDIAGILIVAGLTVGLIATWNAMLETLFPLIEAMLLIGAPLLLLLVRHYASTTKSNFSFAFNVLKGHSLLNGRSC